MTPPTSTRGRVRIASLRRRSDELAAEARGTKAYTVARVDADTRTRRARWVYEDAVLAADASAGVIETICARMNRLGDRSATLRHELAQQRDRFQRLADEAEFDLELGEPPRDRS